MHSPIEVPTAEAMEDLGGRLAQCARDGDVIYLQGNLGAGKSTLVRGFLRRLGHAGAVTSPTYTLVEPYSVAGRRIVHFDLYRLSDPEELEYLGVRDYFDGSAICLVEWPERGMGVLPAATLAVSIDYHFPGRAVGFKGGGDRGRELMSCLEHQ